MSEENKQRLKEYQKNYRKAKKPTQKKFSFFFFTFFFQKFLIFAEQCINKNAFHKNRSPVSIDKLGIRRIVLSKKDLYRKKGLSKYFIGYISENNAFSISLYIKLSQMNRSAKYFDSETNYMNVLVHNKELLKKYNAIWNKINNLLKKGLIMSQCIMINTLKLK